MITIWVSCKRAYMCRGIDPSTGLDANFVLRPEDGRKCPSREEHTEEARLLFISLVQNFPMIPAILLNC